MKRIRLLFPCLLFLFSVEAKGVSPDYYFQQLSLDKGLSQTTVHSILVDHKGLFWIGTASGLNCFDRYDMKCYFHEKDNPHSLPGNTIWFIAEDSAHNVWISTNNGLALYDKGGDSFIPVTFEGKKIVTNSFCTSPGQIFFTTTEGLCIYDCRTGEMERKQVAPEGSPRFIPHHVIPWDDDGRLLIVSYRSGVVMYDPATDLTLPTSYPVQTNINAAFLDSRKRLYLSSYNQGLVCYAPDGRALYRLDKDNSKLNNDLILDFAEIDDKLWISTDGGGINVMDMDDHNDITAIMHTQGEMNTLPVNSVTCLYKDLQNNLWAGTVRGGMIGIKEVFMKTYKDVPLNNPGGLSDLSVISIHEDPEGRLWLGTDGGGINRYNPVTDTFSHYPSTYGDKIVSITDWSDSQLLVSLYAEGLRLFDKGTGRYSRPFHVVDEATTVDQFHGDNASLAYKVTSDLFYFLGKNAVSLDVRTGKAQFLRVDGGNLAVGPMKMVCTDDRSAFIIQSNNLYEARHGNDTLKTLLRIGEHETIKAVARDRDGIFWIGTEYGFGWFDSNTKIFTKIETKLFDSVSTLLLDEQERLWIGARNMLFTYDLKKKRFASWGESDGYTTNEFIYKYQVSSISDYIYLGGASGLLRINKSISIQDEPLSEVGLMDVLLNGKSCVDQLETGGNRITVPHTNSSIEIKVSSMEKDVFRKKLYRYMINGIDRQYTETYNHTLSLSMLSPGSYSIRVSCNSKSGEWSEPVEVLHITVTPPWYCRGYTIVLFVLLSLSLIVWSQSIVRRRRNRKLRWQMKEHVNKMNEERVRFLIDISHELRTPLTLIYAPLKRILDKNGPTTSDGLKAELIGIHKQVLDMRNTIDMVLDMNTLKEAKNTLHKTPNQVNEWIVSVGSDFENELRARRIRIDYRLDETLGTVSFDSPKCATVLSNILMNAMKFSPSGATITVSSRAMEGKVHISVADQGIGLGNVDIGKLFTRHYRGDHDLSGSGIGLSFARMLIEMHNGSIGATDNHDGGATFFFELPLDGGDYPQEGSQDNRSLLETTIGADAFPTDNYSVLVVEDRKELRSFLMDSLRESFKNIYIAADGKEALEIIDRRQPDIVVSDIMMPVMNGYELCRRIKEDVATCHIPVILLTARGDPESTTMGYKLGADTYLSKPFSVDLLLAAIGTQLKNRETVKQKYRESHWSLPQSFPERINNPDEAFMAKLNKLIHDNISSRELDVKFLTARMGMSRTPLYTKLKALTNMGVNDYINMIRIDRASQLLMDQSMNITEISDAVGFEYSRHFSTLFKRIKGISPSQFRIRET